MSAGDVLGGTQKFKYYATQSIVSGATYKLTFNAEVTHNGTSETVSGHVELTAP